MRQNVALFSGWYWKIRHFVAFPRAGPRYSPLKTLRFPRLLLGTQNAYLSLEAVKGNLDLPRLKFKLDSNFVLEGFRRRLCLKK